MNSLYNCINNDDFSDIVNIEEDCVIDRYRINFLSSSSDDNVFEYVANKELINSCKVDRKNYYIVLDVLFGILFLISFIATVYALSKTIWKIVNSNSHLTFLVITGLVCSVACCILFFTLAACNHKRLLVIMEDKIIRS